jgi:peptidoglycan/LPS O-acetylase OafA/YrhL
MAALAVFLVHFEFQVSRSAPLRAVSHEPAAAVLWWFVDLVRALGPDIFLVLSGFLLSRKFISDEQSLRCIISRRVSRIFPLYLLVLAVYVLCGLWVPTEPRMPAQASAATLYLLNNVLLVPLAFGVMPVISAAWTLGVLMVLYISFPALARLGGLSRWSSRRRATAFAGGAAILLALPPAPVTIGAAMFLGGAIARELLDLVPRSRGSALVLAGIAAIALALRTWELLPYVLRVVLRIVAVAPLLLCLATRCLPWLQPLFERRAIRAFGRISYSYYLFHGAVIVAIRLFLFPVAAQVAPSWAVVPVLLAACFAASAVGSAVVYKMIEEPLRALRYPQFRVRAYAPEPVTSPRIRPGNGQHAQSARAGA